MISLLTAGPPLSCQRRSRWVIGAVNLAVTVEAVLSQHVLVYRVDSHTNHLQSSIGKNGEGAWEMSLLQAKEVVDALNYYSAGDLEEKLERITGHGHTKPNDTRYPNQHDKNRRVELSLVLDMSKEDLAQFK